MSAEQHPTPAPGARRQRLALAVVVVCLLVLSVIVIHSAGDDATASADVAPSSHAAMASHAAMVGKAAPAPDVSTAEYNAALYPPPAQPYKPGRVREFTMRASDRTIEIAKGVKFSAWTFNGTVPGPTIRVTEGDLVKIHFVNAGSHPHTIHFHGIHQADQDGVFETVEPGDTFTYSFTAIPGGLQLYHCHAAPLKKHIHKGLYGTFIVDPRTPRAPAKEMTMLMTGYDTDGDSENNFYTVNGKAFLYAKYPVKVKQGELVRIYLGNMTEFDLVNSFHLHGNFFRYYPSGSTNRYDYTDMVTLAQGERGVIETVFPYPGRYMFHAHQSEFADLGWMGYIDVQPDGVTPKGKPAPAGLEFASQSDTGEGFFAGGDSA
jgi:FtsP/CotA-like multicopper oxidase with cupredoxin domain